MFSEINKLHKMLSQARLPHTFGAFYLGNKPIGYQIRLFEDEDCYVEIDDCVCHSFSHGFEIGLLETYSLNGCEGYETAEQVFAGWVKMYNERNKRP